MASPSEKAAHEVLCPQLLIVPTQARCCRSAQRDWKRIWSTTGQYHRYWQPPPRADKITIDFMSQIVWVEPKDVETRFLTLEGKLTGTENDVRILCLHPLDCLKNRLGNINILNRRDEQALRSAEASIMVLDAFIDEILTLGWLKEAKLCFRELEYIVRNKCATHRSFLDFNIDPSPILRKYVLDKRLDKIYRNKTMVGQIRRVAAVLARKSKLIG